MAGYSLQRAHQKGTFQAQNDHLRAWTRLHNDDARTRTTQSSAVPIARNRETASPQISSSIASRQTQLTEGGRGIRATAMNPHAPRAISEGISPLRRSSRSRTTPRRRTSSPTFLLAHIRTNEHRRAYTAQSYPSRETWRASPRSYFIHAHEQTEKLHC